MSAFLHGKITFTLICPKAIKITQYDRPICFGGEIILADGKKWALNAFK